MSADVVAVAIRPATTADLAALGRLGAEMVRVHHAFDSQRFMAPARDVRSAEGGYARFLRSQLDEPDAMVLVAERDGAVVGYAYAALEGRSWEALREPAGMIHDVVVDEAVRGQGIGSALVDAVCRALAARGAPRIVLWSAERNEGAQRLFERLSFRRTMIEYTREL